MALPDQKFLVYFINDEGARMYICWNDTKYYVSQYRTEAHRFYKRTSNINNVLYYLENKAHFVNLQIESLT